MSRHRDASVIFAHGVEIRAPRNPLSRGAGFCAGDEVFNAGQDMGYDDVNACRRRMQAVGLIELRIGGDPIEKEWVKSYVAIGVGGCDRGK
jgi:hypothetical protein